MSWGARRQVRHASEELRAKPPPTAAPLTVVEPCGPRREKIRKAKKASRPSLADFSPVPNSVAEGPEAVPRIAVWVGNELAADPPFGLRHGLRDDRSDRNRGRLRCPDRGVHRPERKSLAARSVTIAGVVLLLFALGGGAVLSLLRVSLPAFRVAGGMLLFLQALTLTFSNPGLSSINASETRDAQGAGDIAIFPLAFPVIAGPGSLAAVVLVVGRTELWLERAAIMLMVAICLAVTYVAMLVSERLVRHPGQTGSDVVGRIASAIIVAERSHLGSFRSLACDEVVRAPTDPEPLDLDCGPSFRQGHCPPRPTLSVAPAGRKPGESDQEIQEEAPRFAKEGPARGCSGNTCSLSSRVCMKRPTQNRP
jgi:multiple antibiotic resistance protein